MTYHSNNSSNIDFETWFIPTHVFLMISLSLAVIFSSLPLLTIMMYKKHHTVPMMLIANSFLTEFLFATHSLWTIVVTYRSDLKQSYDIDLSCIVGCYLSYVFGTLINYSFMLQSVYRYLSAVYPTRLFWRSFRIQRLFIAITWLVAIGYPLSFVFNGDIVYNADNKVCHIPLEHPLSLFLMISNVYLIPILSIQSIYLKLVLYVKGMGKRVTVGNSLIRAQNELKMVRQIVSMLIVLTLPGLPYTVFMLMSFFTNPPKYHLRIASISVNGAFFLFPLTLFHFTEPLKSALSTKINERSQRVAAIII